MDIRTIEKRLAAGQPVTADFFDTITGKQTFIRVVRVARSRYGHLHLTGINGEKHENLTLDRVCFGRG